MKTIIIVLFSFLWLQGITNTNSYQPCFGIVNITIKIGSIFRNSCIPEPTISVSNKQKVAVSRTALCNGREVDYIEIFIDSLPYIIHKTFVTIDENELAAFENNQKIYLETLMTESRKLSVEIKREKEDKELELKG